jgi:hypothetical protein
MVWTKYLSLKPDHHISSHRDCSPRKSTKLPKKRESESSEISEFGHICMGPMGPKTGSQDAFYPSFDDILGEQKPAVNRSSTTVPRFPSGRRGILGHPKKRRGPRGPMVVLEQSMVHCEATWKLHSWSGILLEDPNIKHPQKHTV